MRHNFRKLEVYNEAILLAKLIFSTTKNFPDNEKFGLTSQINRACVSVPSNISEDSSRNSSKEFSRFISFSIGSLFELETQLILAKEFGYLNQNTLDNLLEKIIQLQKRLSIFKNKIEQE